MKMMKQRGLVLKAGTRSGNKSRLGGRRRGWGGGPRRPRAAALLGGGEFFFFKVTGHGLSRSLERLCGEQLSEVSVSFDFVGTV